MNVNRLLVIYSTIVTLAFVGWLGTEVFAARDADFAEINVERINLREADGTLRLVIANSALAPGTFVRNVERPHPSGQRGAGMYFLNEEGTENGGLLFSGRRRADGTITGSGHLSFDQYEQDQVIQITQVEQGASRWAALVVSDRPDASLFEGEYQQWLFAADSPERNAALMRMQEEGAFGRQRVWVGKSRDRESAVVLSDEMGRPRLRLRVTPGGDASIEFLSEDGAVARTLAP